MQSQNSVGFCIRDDHIVDQSRHNATHHAGSTASHHGVSPLFDHPSNLEDSHMSVNEHSLISNHGISHMSHDKGSCIPHYKSHHISHNGAQHVFYDGSKETCHRKGQQVIHHAGKDTSHYEASHLPHHKAYHMLQCGQQKMPYHGGNLGKSHHLQHQGKHHMSNHAYQYMPNHGGNISHHGGHQKSISGGHNMHHHRISENTSSIHAGSDCNEAIFSKISSFGSSCGFPSGFHGKERNSGDLKGWKNDGLFGANEKQIMQLLNERLSSYLGTVRTLEQDNAKLERNISEWYKNNPPKTPPNGTQYFRIIKELQSEIAQAETENSGILLQMDNARLAAEDFRSKYGIELQQSDSTVMDLNNLVRVQEGLNREAAELVIQVQNLEEELQEINMSSAEEIDYLLDQLGARINVELNAAPSIDLNVTLSEIREEYETLMDRNLRETEAIFLQRSEELNWQMVSGSEQLQSMENELIEMKRWMQALEIELQNEISMKTVLEGMLAETEATYGSRLAQLQYLINNAETELERVISDLERQNKDYKILMDQKTYLELEIATYKRLLDGHDIQ
ncbi:keratin, type I cytoskeletal 19-like [Pelodytes ibericus]